jgi:hypothetical protein
MPAYPSTFPLPAAEGLRFSVGSGLVRAEGSTNQAQRRVFDTMPHVFEMTFVMGLRTFSLWWDWAMLNGFRWFDMNLPTMYAGQAGTALSAVTIRFVSDISTVFVAQDTVQVSVSAESAPSMIADYLAVT